MNSVKKFMEIIETKRQAESWSEMTAILKESHQYLKNIPASEKGVILSILFNERTGLLTFLKNAIDQPHINKHLEGAITQTFHLLSPIMEQFVDDYSPYIKETMAVLVLALTLKLSYHVKDAAAKRFVEFIKTFKTLDLDFNPTLIEWMKKFHRYSIPERRLILHVISVISRHFPQTEAFGRSSKAILRELNSDFLKTYEGSENKGGHCLSTYIEALHNILHNFPPSDEDIGTLFGPDSVYRNLKTICNSKEIQKNKQLMQTVVNLLSDHLMIFDEYVYDDYELWHLLFGSFVRNGLYGEAAIRALRLYYRTMGKVLGRKNSENDKRVFLNLRNSFVTSLSDGRICSTELRLTVYGFSQIIEPCKNYLADTGVEEMFSLIAHRTIPLYARENNEAAHFEEIADYQEALSRIIRYLENVTIDQIRALTTLCSLMIKRFPELSITDQQYATSSLNRTIVNVRYTKEIFYHDFITNIIYEGIVWSCSHMLFIDAELQSETEKDFKYPTTYKDYVPLWQALLNPENYTSSVENSDTGAAAVQRVVDEIITTCIVLMNTLNLETKVNENNAFHDVKDSHKVANETDFRIFLNLVDLYTVILPSIENFLWRNTLEKFLYEIIKNSYKNPIISGFYKLANATLTSSGAFQCTDNHKLNNESFRLVLQYLWTILEALPRYPRELQISCLKLILNVPEALVRRIVDRAVPAFKISLNIGLTNYEVAIDAVSALEHWHEYLGGDLPKNFICQLLPCLEMFLQSDECSSRFLHDIEESRQRKSKKVTLLDDEQTVEGFQKRILLFFGSLDSEIMLEYIHQRSLKTGATWSKKDLLKYPMPFPDTNLDINLDSMLPRIINLALSSGDRRTRVVASEVLHTIVAFMLGKTVHFLAYDNDRFTPLYETLCPALLRLSCDSDDVIMQLYQPLVMQLTHWLSSRLMLNSGATIYLVDSLFDCLGDETNSSLREVSGIYLAEFVHWSIKQTSDKSLANCPTNINLIVRRIVNFALDTATDKRVAAATAFNHLYVILRENDEIVNIFWLELLHAFVKSLEGCKDSRIHDALRHVERVLLEKCRIFNEESSRRQRPPGFSGVKSEDAAKWMFRQCGTVDRDCRFKCMEMFETISRSVDNCDSPKTLISMFLKSDGIRGLDEILFCDLNYNFCTKNGEGLTLFLRSLDLHVWLIRKRLIDHDVLFGDVNPHKNVIFNCMQNFITGNLAIVNNFVVENHASTYLREFVSLRYQRCETVITMFDFILAIADVRETSQNLIPDTIFSDSLFSLVSVCLIQPHRLGFDSSNLQLTEQLPTKLEQFLTRVMHLSSIPKEFGLSESLVNSMNNIITANIQTFSGKLFMLDEITKGEVSVSENSVRGLILLQKCGYLKFCNVDNDILTDPSKRIMQIYDLLKTDNLGKKVCFYPKLETKVYLQRLVELLLMDYDVGTMKIVVRLLTNTAELYRSDLTVTTHGEYFLSVFKDVVIQGFLRDVEQTLILLENSIKDNPENILRIVEALVLYLQRNRSKNHEMVENAANLIMGKFHVFERSVNNLEYRRNICLNIYAMVVRLKRNSLLERDDDMYRWILRELVSSNSFKYKIRLLRDFLVCLTNENFDDNPELVAILYNLKNERKIGDSNGDGLGQKIVSPETIDCFQNLLKLLPATRSSVVLDALMNFSVGAGKTLCEDKVDEYLKDYYASLQAPNVLKSLEMTYKRFMNSANANDRFDILHYFLLPPLANCAPQTMEKFFESNMKDIYEIIMQKPTTNINDRRQLFVSKIACYNLVEIMFANLPRDRIDSKESAITIDTTDSGSSDKFSRRIFRSTLPVRQLSVIEGEDREIVRLLHCAAYKCSIAIVSMTKDERFYLAVFGENREKNQLIWENIVDVQRKYELRQTSKEYPKEREKLVNIRKSEKDKKGNEDSYSYVKSYDLATSTLSDNIYTYDLNAVNLSRREKDDPRTNEIMSLRLEIDDLNDHECMPLICGLLIHMLNNEISRPRSDGTVVELPKWMAQFRTSMGSKYANVRLFMLKIVLNTQAVFRPYANFFLEPVINTIYRCLKEDTLNYVITDALIMLIGWREIYVPRTVKETTLARLMFSFLIERGTAAPTRYIVKYNMSIIELIVEAWHDCLELPVGLDSRISKSDPTAVKLVLIFLTNKMADKIVVREDVWEYLKKALADWKVEEEVVLQTHEAAGLILRYSVSMEHFESRKKEITEIVRNVFRSMQIPNPGRLVKCAHALCKAFPDFAEDFYQFVSSSQLRVESTNMVKCLEVFSLVVSKLSVENIVKELNYMQFNALLENKVLSCEKICLKIVEQLVPVLEPVQLLGLVELASRYWDHEILEYRQICNNIFTKVYKKYSGEQSVDHETISIMNISRKILLSGLLDPAEDMQKLSLNFWSDITDSRKKCSERLLDILDTYECGIETNFLQILTVVMLELTRKSTGCDKKMFEPLHNCKYNDHDISISWKSRNYESRIPLFAPSLASQLNQRFTQYSYAMGTSSYKESDSLDNFHLRATNAPQFEATYLSLASIPGKTANNSDDEIFAVPKVPEQQSRNKVSRRFLANWSDINVAMQKKKEAKHFSEQEYKREYLARKRGSVRLYRKYRIGDFPDIEITHETMLGPMQQLVKRDTTMCKDLIVSIIGSLMDRTIGGNDSESYCEELSKRLTKILRQRRQNGGAIAAILEILFNVRELEFPWDVVAEVAKTDGLYAQGALLTEQTLINEPKIDSEPPSKKARISGFGEREEESRNQWIELAGLYESMDDVDVVLGIFRSDMFSKELHMASAARAANDWTNAEDFYRKAFDVETGSRLKRHCLEGTFECLSRLGKWKKLESDIESKVTVNFDDLLNSNESSESQWIVPWIFRTHTQRIMGRRGNERFLNAMKVYLNDTIKYQRLKQYYGEETSVIVSTEKPEVSRDFLNGSWENIRQGWIRLSPLAVPLRSRAIIKLRGIHDIDRYLKTLAKFDIVESSRELMNSWKNSIPSMRDDLLSWDIYLSYRWHFTANLMERIGQPESQEGIEIVNEIRSTRIGQSIRLIECALNQKNVQLAKRYLLRIDPELKFCQQEVIDHSDLNAIRFKFLDAQLTNDTSTKLKHYASSWEQSHKILRSSSLGSFSQIAVRQVISEMASSLAEIATSRMDFMEALSARTSIVQDIFGQHTDFDSITDALNRYSFTNLRECCMIDDIGDCHLRLSKYCYDRISKGDNDHSLRQHFVTSTLQAMSCGSVEATHYFPCLLKDDILFNDDIKHSFKAESSKVETWRFLIWQTQLLSHLGTHLGNIVMPIVKRMIDAYPNAMVYSVRLALDTNIRLRNDPSVVELTNFLVGKHEFNTFLEAMEYIVQPELYMEYYLQEFLRNFPRGRETAHEMLMKRLYPANSVDGISSIQGDIYRDIVTPYRREIERILEMPFEEISEHVNRLMKRLMKDESLKKRQNKSELASYSPWLKDFVGHDIEVPGQYSGNKKPIPRYHAKIFKIKSTVKVMQSLRKPIRITILTNDAKNYNFLVKFGEDLRLDQRVEQIFDVMNETLKTDVACSQRRLSIDTYQVFPLSGSLGFIQWIDGTKTLREYINFALDDNEKVQQECVISEYKGWIRKAAPDKTSKSMQYKEALVKYSATEVKSKIMELTNKIRWDSLRRTFVMLSSSMETFMSMRRNFTSTYATMCIGQWMLGIGDRHLDNTLISVESGRSLGIDFGSAFGGGVDQSVPELMPFRLTAQIKGLLRPFNEFDSMGATMIHATRALRNGKGPLLACLDVVAHEQLNWEKHVNKLSQETENVPVEIEWLPAKRIRIVSRKLDGVKPSSIILEQLAERHSDEQYFSRYEAIVNGRDLHDNPKRLCLSEDNLTPEEQVQCLIELATDLNVLGRVYVGWEPWL